MERRYGGKLKSRQIEEVCGGNWQTEVKGESDTSHEEELTLLLC